MNNIMVFDTAGKKNCNFTVRLESEEWRVEIAETYGFRVSYAEFNGIDDKGNGSISLSSLYTLQSPLSHANSSFYVLHPAAMVCAGRFGVPSGEIPELPSGAVLFWGV